MSPFFTDTRINFEVVDKNVEVPMDAATAAGLTFCGCAWHAACRQTANNRIRSLLWFMRVIPTHPEWAAGNTGSGLC